jgi:DNA-directed RNA polymerase subunit RPC12/RpoP
LFWLFIIASPADKPSTLNSPERGHLDDQSQLANIDVEKRTTRGRACPVCGGKIIPSERAVYQNTADPTAVYPLWECERCGYQELVERAPKAAKKH